MCSDCKGDQPGLCLDCSLNVDGENEFLWFANAEGRCVKCSTTVDGCQRCAPLTGECSSCSGGLVAGQCVECADENCWRCDASASVCNARKGSRRDGCREGYFPDAAGVCQPVSEGRRITQMH